MSGAAAKDAKVLSRLAYCINTQKQEQGSHNSQCQVLLGSTALPGLSKPAGTCCCMP